MNWNRRCLAAILLAAIACGCSERASQADATAPRKEPTVLPQNVHVRLGESAESFVKRYPEGVKIDRQPAGLNFYSIDWDKSPHATVSVDHGANSFDVPLVLGIQTSEDQEALKPEGFFTYSIYAALTDQNTLPHDEARQKTYTLLRRILGAGWRPVIERSEPRLSGKTRQDYMFATTNSNGLDATHMPTLDEWMRIPSRTPWSFYANGVYMDVSFTREPTLTDPAKPGAYLLTFNLKTETEYFRGFASPDKRMQWKDVVPAELKKVAEMRELKEAELRGKGIAIDESYQDPPAPRF